MPVTNLAHASAELALWLGIALLVAKLGAEVAERVLHQPAVVGELAAGILIGPYALGGLDLPGFGRLFPVPAAGAIGVPEPLWVFGQIAAVLLLFGAGLSTDFAAFMRFAPSALAVAVGGVIVPFVLGDAVAVAVGLAPGPFSAEALFVGAILAATSVGVTARVLGDIGKLDTPEGATILGAAVIDDVIGVLVLALVVAASGTAAGGTAVDLGMLALRTIGLWLGFSALLVLLARPFGRSIRGLRTGGAAVAFAVALALVAGWVAESMGLAMIIGSFSAGLALSRTSLRRQLDGEIRVLEHALVPVFFVSMGMLVNLPAIVPDLGVGLLLTVVAVAGKIAGAAVPALFADFTRVGALRVGFGMVPRGEVALVVAAIGLARGAIDAPLFGIAVLIAVLTTVVTPLPLVRAFRLPGPGTRSQPVTPWPVSSVHSLVLPHALGTLFEGHLVASLACHGYDRAGSWTDAHGARGLELRRNGQIVSLVIREADAGPRFDLESELPMPDLAAILATAAERAGEEVMTALGAARRPLMPPGPGHVDLPNSIG